VNWSLVEHARIVATKRGAPIDVRLFMPPGLLLFPAATYHENGVDLKKQCGAECAGSAKREGLMVRGAALWNVAAVVLGAAAEFSCGSENTGVGDAGPNSGFDGATADVGSTDLGNPDTGSPQVCSSEEWGPHGVGFLRAEFVDVSRGDRSLPALVYHPAGSEPNFGSCYRSFLMTDPLSRLSKPAFCAVEDAPPDRSSAPYPVVVLSHGNGSQKEAHSFVFEYLASHGFVAVGFDHAGNTGPGQTEPEDELMSVTRALDVSFVIDKLVESFAGGEGALSGLGDPERIGVAGHSWGGHTALSIAGIRYSFDVIEEDCKNGDEPDRYYCPLLDHREEIEDEIPDPRVKAVLTYAHDAGHQVSGPNCRGAAGITIPFMQILGDSDGFISVQEDGYDCYEKAAGPACIVVLEGAGHLGYTVLGDEGTLGADRIFDLVRWYSAAFFRAHLAGDVSCAQALAEAPVSWNQGKGDHVAQCRPAR
jgi:predicted dienelactone hydrolase